jgi:hypothetical protein
MTPNEWAAIITCCIGVIVAVYSGARFMVRAIMRELQPNGGASLKDQVNRIEARIDILFEKLIETPKR